MPFYTLQSGEEILLDITDIPEPPEEIFRDNPYLKEDPMFKQWRSAQKARYTKSCYKAIREAKDSDDFINRVGDARSLLKDPSVWEEYLSCRGLDQPKRKPGRPILPDKLKKNPTKVKRSDQMKVLLLEHDIIVGSDGSLHSKDGIYVGWKFQINGRVKFEDEDPVSVHKFLTLI